MSARRVPVDWPREAEEKSDQNGPLFERSEFGPFRFFLSIAGSGQSSGSPFFGYFFWRSKKSDSPSGETDGVQSVFALRFAWFTRWIPAFAGMTAGRWGESAKPRFAQRLTSA
jgi:hypothetical protein